MNMERTQQVHPGRSASVATARRRCSSPRRTTRATTAPRSTATTAGWIATGTARAASPARGAATAWAAPAATACSTVPSRVRRARGAATADPTPGVEVSDDGTAVAFTYLDYTGLHLHELQLLAARTSRTTAQNLILTKHDRWTGRRTLSGTSRAASSAGSHKWRFGALAFTEDGRGLVFWAGAAGLLRRPAPATATGSSNNMAGAMYWTSAHRYVGHEHVRHERGRKPGRRGQDLLELLAVRAFGHAAA